MNVCLGADGSSSNNNLNLFEEAHIAALIHKGFNRDPECMSASAVIKMMTENGAKAASFNDVGKIAPGYKADIILIDANKPHICPVNDVKSSIIYSVQASDVDTVFVNGKIMMRNRVLVSMDEELIISKVKEIAKLLGN
jgi:5-methylthioadenosine/S-adenosylhomocysteine deaminase